jgi:hypothetical protein
MVIGPALKTMIRTKKTKKHELNNAELFQLLIMQFLNIPKICFLFNPEISPHIIKIPNRVMPLRGRNITTHCPTAVIPINPDKR